MTATRSYDFQRRNDVNGQNHKLHIGARVNYRGESWLISARFFAPGHGKGLAPVYSLARMDDAGNTLTFNYVPQEEILLPMEDGDEA